VSLSEKTREKLKISSNKSDTFRVCLNVLQATLHFPKFVCMPPEAVKISISDEAVADLMRQHWAELFAYARGILRSDTAAQDAVQDAFVTLWKTPPQAGVTRAWLYRVCRSRAIDALRKQSTEMKNRVELTPEQVAVNADKKPLPNDFIQREEMVGTIFSLLEKLPERQRELVRLKFQGGLSYKEISDITGLTVTNVGFILHTALTTLKTLFDAQRKTEDFSK